MLHETLRKFARQKCLFRDALGTSRMTHYQSDEPYNQLQHSVCVCACVCAAAAAATGGLVFTPLTSPFLEMVFGAGSKRSRRSDIPVPIMVALNQDKQHAGQQIVILVQVS